MIWIRYSGSILACMAGVVAIMIVNYLILKLTSHDTLYSLVYSSSGLKDAKE